MAIQRYLFIPMVLALTGLSWLGVQPMAHAADLNNVRIKPYGGRTEIVLDLKGNAADDLVINSENPHMLTLQFTGKIDGALKNRSQSFAGHQNLKSVYWEAKDGKVQVFIKRQAPSTYNVYPLPNPNRLVINVSESYSYTTTETVAPGVAHHRIVRSTQRGPLLINVLEIDPAKNPDLVIEPVLATDRVHGKAKVSQMVSRNGALAGINAAFFKPDSGTNLGTVILNKELVAGPIYNRVALGMTSDKKYKMDRLSLAGTLSTQDGQSLKIHNVNQPRLSKDQYILYTPRWGRTAPPTPKNGVQVQIQRGQVIAVSTERLTIPYNGYVLVGPAAGFAHSLQPNDNIALSIYTVPDWSDVENALSGGPYLVKNGEIYVDTREQSFRPGGFTQANPRTAVGFTADNHLLMVTVDGRQRNVSVGATLYDMARLMKDLGTVEAMNFDGGSSTQMVVKGRLVNSPSVNGGALVSSSLVVRQLPPPISREIIGASTDVTAPTDF